MKVLYLTNHLNAGGVTSYLLTLSKGLKDLGHEVFILSGPGNLSEKFEAAGAKLLDPGMRLKSDSDVRIYFLSAHLNFLKEQRIDIVHAQTRVGQIIGQRYAGHLGVPFVSTCHGFFKPRFMRRIFPCWGDRVIAISKPVEKHLHDDFHVASSKIVYIPNGIDLTEFTLPTQARKDEIRSKYNMDRSPNVGIVARLSDVKGHDDLIRAFKLVLNNHRDARLLIIGEGPMEDDLRRLVEGLELRKHVHFIKVVGQTAQILPLLDVFVMPSLQEGLGLSVLEAQATGLPVVATRVGGLPDIIEHNRTGLLVDPRDPQSLAQAINEVLAHPAKAWDMGRAAHHFVEKQYSAGRMVRSTVDLYDQLVKA